MLDWVSLVCEVYGSGHTHTHNTYTNAHVLIFECIRTWMISSFIFLSLNTIADVVHCWFRSGVMISYMPDIIVAMLSNVAMLHDNNTAPTFLRKPCISTCCRLQSYKSHNDTAIRKWSTLKIRSCNYWHIGTCYGCVSSINITFSDVFNQLIRCDFLLTELHLFRPTVAIIQMKNKIRFFSKYTVLSSTRSISVYRT